MPETVDPLVLDLVEWIAREPRRYADVMDAWRTSCPRLMVWEEAIDRGLVQREVRTALGMCVVVTDKGLRAVEADRRPARSAAPAVAAPR